MKGNENANDEKPSKIPPPMHSRKGGSVMDASEFKRHQLNAIKRKKKTVRLLYAVLIVVAIAMLVAVVFAYTMD